MTLFTQAKALAQAGVAIIPLKADRSPALKGWQEKATTDLKTIEKWFGGEKGRYYGIGVPCGPEQDLICFDLDFGKTEDQSRLDKLDDWYDAHFDKELYMVRKTRSGGLHVICGWPHLSNSQIPRTIMPKFDVIKDGFYFVWDTLEGEYAHFDGVDRFDDIAIASVEMCRQLEKPEGASGDGGQLPTDLEAHEVLVSNGDDGMRHEALLKLAYDWVMVEGNYDTDWRVFEAWFLNTYGSYFDEDRLKMLTSGEENEICRAVVGAQKQYAPASDDLLARAAEKLAGSTPLMEATREVRDQAQEGKDARAFGEEFEDIDLNQLRDTELPDIDWIVDDLIPAGNLISIVGPSGAGKTRFNAMLMAALSSGNTEAIGLPAAERPIRSLYIANEERTEDVKRRLKAAAVMNNLVGDMLLTVRGKEHGAFRLIEGSGTKVKDQMDRLIKMVKERNIELVMIDPVATVGIEDEDKSMMVAPAMEMLQRVAAATGACVMYVHHTPKGDRSAAVDQWRGDDRAWRGSGLFYSSLDLGLTLVPWLPDECHEQGRGTANRRRWAAMVRDHKAPKFVALDSAKERENEGLASVLYEIVGQEVRVGGRRIGAMRPVSFAAAQREATRLLAASPEVDEAVATSWGRALANMFPDEGSHATSLRAIAEYFDTHAPFGWSVDRNKDERLRSDRGTGKAIIDTLKSGVRVTNKMLSIEVAEKGGVRCQVSQVS